MLLSDEQIKEKGFTPEQIEVVNSNYTAKESELLALANKNADGIFNGAAAKLTEMTGIAKGDNEKFSAYFERLGSEYLPEASKSQIEKARQEAEEWKSKFENHKGDETFKNELNEYKTKVEKFPELLSAKENEWKAKYEALENDTKSYKVTNSINSSMPKFDDSVNKFELEAKKKQAIDRIQNDYELSFDEKGNLIGTKDYQKVLVADLLKNDPDLKELILIEQSQGGGGEGAAAKGKTLNLPADISKGAAQHLIQVHMSTVEGIDTLNENYAARFKELCKENNVL